MFHPFLKRELEFNSSLFHVNNSTNCAKKRTSQNNWTRGFTLNFHNTEIKGNIIVIDNDKNIVDLPQRLIYGRINKTNTKITRIKRFQIKHIIHSFGHNRGTCSNITKSKTREVIQFNFIIGSQPSSSFLVIEASSLSFSSLTLIRAFVICSMKERLSVLVWGSLDILCRKLITSGKVQLSKSNSLLSIKEVVISFKLTCLKASMFIEFSSSRVEVVASPLIGPVGVGV